VSFVFKPFWFRLVRVRELLDKLRLYLRLAHQRQLTSHQQYLFAAESLTEIGKLLGGWIKTMP
jgi:hypothetical protein